MKPLLFFFLVFCALSTEAVAQTAPDSTKRLLVVSGGGARGAWGVGVLSELIKRNGGYTAVFGTSTGSLMAPMILLGDMDTLAAAYSNVTQTDIFNKSPFNVNYDAATNTVTTSLKTLQALFRFIFGKKTFGESKPLLGLIKQFLTETRYDSLIDGFTRTGLQLAVAVTNTRTGEVKFIYDSSFSKSPVDYANLCRWIWASADEPLYMTYVKMGDDYYVDGGVREVIPIQQGLIYAIDHNIDNVDVVINNSKVPIDQNWSPSGGGILYGLERLLNIYDLGIVNYNDKYGQLLAAYFNEVGKPAAGSATTTGSADTATTKKTYIHMKFYCMPDSLATKYAQSLGFIKPAMQYLIQQGKIYGSNPNNNCFDIKVDKQAMRNKRAVLTTSP
jgi:NTE family protein